MSETPLKSTPLEARHIALGGKMVPFAGYNMPVQYPMGVLAEHNWTRQSAGLFDVSHMGQGFLIAADGSHETAARALETLCPADVLNLKPAQVRYSQLLNDNGGIRDDFMVTRLATPGSEGWLYLVVNAACKDADFAHIAANLPAGVSLRRADDLALLALQGPEAVNVLKAHLPQVEALPFMHCLSAEIDGRHVQVSRSGYTGEDGFEISIRECNVGFLWDLLLNDARVKPIGLGARDSLRLEGGLCLYGHDIDETTTPIEGALAWSIQKRRRLEGGFPGAAIIQKQLAEGAPRRRVGILPEGKAPAREGTEIVTPDGVPLGVVTSGGFGPTLGGPLAMGYVPASHAAPGTPVGLMVRGKLLPAKIVSLPFVPNRFVRIA